MKLIFLLSALLLLGCSADTKTETQTMPEKESDSLHVASEKEISKVEHLKFPEADSTLYSFFSKLDEVEKFIDPESGLYCIEPGPGVTPLLEKLNGKTDLMGKTPFLFLCRDAAFIKNNVKINPRDFDPCNLKEEGYFIFEHSQGLTKLADIYNTYKNQQLDPPGNILLNDLKKIDQLVQKSVIVNFTDKHGDPNMLKLYFHIKNNTPYLYILDLSECGV